MPTDLEILLEATRLLESGAALTLCTIIEKKGSAAREIGAKMIVSEDGKTFGTIGGGSVERCVVAECLKAIGTGKSSRVTFNLGKNHSSGTIETGMICGGEITVLLDVLAPTPRLVIVGTGNIALPLATLANTVGFKVIIVDNSQRDTSKQQFPMAETIITGEYDEVISSIKLTVNDYIIIAHGEPEQDYKALESVMRKEVAYIGLLGSRTKASILTQKLKNQGVSEEKLKTLHSPVGLAIGAETPEEIGISILAEVIQVKEDGLSKQLVELPTFR